MAKWVVLAPELVTVWSVWLPSCVSSMLLQTDPVLSPARYSYL